MVKKTIGLLTGGGDVPGLNPCMKAVVLGALENDYRVLGIKRGWAGLINYNLNDSTTYTYDDNICKLNRYVVRTIDRTGGTFIHTSRINPQRVVPKLLPEHLKNSPLITVINDNGVVDCTNYVLSVIEELGIDVLVTIGGDDTLSYSVRLHQEGIPIIGIPKTIDNDVFGTDYCIGFSTAVTRSVDFITNMRTSIGSHERIGIVELFGRNSGETSLVSGYLSYADRVIIPEVPFSMDKLIEFLIHDKRNNPSNYAIMTISEGAIIEGRDVIEYGDTDAYGHRKLGGVGQIVAQELIRLAGVGIMYQQLAYLMRSGAPDSLDRMVAISFGNLAIQLINRSETGKMVGLHGGKYTTVPIEMVLTGQKKVDISSYYDIDSYLPRVRDIMGVPMFLS